jgi:methylated-DNA-[protein]-cysteine S-methyltransferase
MTERASLSGELGEHPLAQSDTAMHYCLIETGLGPLGLMWSDAGIVRLQLPEKTPTATERRLTRRVDHAGAARPPAPIAQAGKLLQHYMKGERVDFADVALDLTRTSDFHRAIYAAARRLGWGQTSTYGALAREAGAPDAARAVGQAMGRNPVPIIIPCHRVLASGNKIGGFSAFGGATTKERLLAMEGVHLGSGTPLLPGLLLANGRRS